MLWNFALHQSATTSPAAPLCCRCNAAATSARTRESPAPPTGPARPTKATVNAPSLSSERARGGGQICEEAKPTPRGSLESSRCRKETYTTIDLYYTRQRPGTRAGEHQKKGPGMVRFDQSLGPRASDRAPPCPARVVLGTRDGEQGGGGARDGEVRSYRLSPRRRAAAQRPPSPRRRGRRACSFPAYRPP
jgi:hypothetical protein